MALILCLKRSDEVSVPSCPLESTSTAEPAIAVAPLIPAIKHAVCVPPVPIRMVLDSPATPLFPISMLLSPVVRLDPACAPIAVLLLPVVLAFNASVPKPAFPVPVMVKLPALIPTNVLFVPKS